MSGSGYYGNEIAYLVIPNGQRLRISGIGPAKATRALDGWRRDVENKARAKAPTTLSASESQQIQKKYGAKLKQIGKRWLSVPAAVAQQEADEIRAQSQQRQARLRTDLQNMRVAAMQQKEPELDQQLRQGRTKLTSGAVGDSHARIAKSTPTAEITFRRLLTGSHRLGEGGQRLEGT